mmetsp:Transcript_37405/g.83238  ORF Transcript_37405/g.83238 Transcript_37405/m.83238 type:complete len:270 (+) Transcript_37405:869-1678(+)
MRSVRPPWRLMLRTRLSSCPCSRGTPTTAPSCCEWHSSSETSPPAATDTGSRLLPSPAPCRPWCPSLSGTHWAQRRRRTRRRCWQRQAPRGRPALVSSQTAWRVPPHGRNVSSRCCASPQTCPYTQRLAQQSPASVLLLMPWWCFLRTTATRAQRSWSSTVCVPSPTSPSTTATRTTRSCRASLLPCCATSPPCSCVIMTRPWWRQHVRTATSAGQHRQGSIWSRLVYWRPCCYFWTTATTSCCTVYAARSSTSLQTVSARRPWCSWAA